MKKFKFNLESVLNYRIVKEEQAKQKLGTAIFKVAQQKKVLGSYRKALAEEQSNIAAAVDISFLQHKELYIHCLCQQIEQQTEQLKQAEKEVNKCKKEVTRAMQDTKVLDNLKVKRYQEYLLEANKMEQKMLDEIGLIGFSHQQLAKSQ